jgi:imidazolonepropionase-like amidohydrolase
VTPGLIDAHSVAGLSGALNIPADQDQDESSDPNQADIRVLDGFNPQEPLLEFLRANGITTIHATPGRSTIIAGRSGVFRTIGRTVEMSAVKPVSGLFINLGETPKETFKEKGPKTRMGVAATVRRAFAEAVAKKGTPGLSTKNEALLAAVDGSLPVYFTAHRADDILTALRIADEFKLKPVLVLATDAHLVLDEIAARKVPVIVHPTMQRPGGSMETRHTLMANAAMLKAKGVPITICTSFEGYVPKQRNLRHEAAMAAVNGLGIDAAMHSVSIDAAKLLGIADKYGSLEVGKIADVVLYDGDPFEHTTHVAYTFMNGKVVYDRSEYVKLPFERRILPLVAGGGGVGCCMDIW